MTIPGVQYPHLPVHIHDHTRVQYPHLPVHIHDHTRGTVPTLAAISLRDTLLDGVVTFSLAADTFHRLDTPAVTSGNRHQTLKMKSRPCLNIRTVFPGMGIPILKIRRSCDRLIFNMGIPILVRRRFYIECYDRNRCQGQGQVITSRGICGM